MDQIRQREGPNHSIWQPTVKPVAEGMLAAPTLKAGIAAGAGMYWVGPNHPSNNLSDWQIVGRAFLDSQATSQEGRMTVLVLGGALLFAFIEHAKSITNSFKQPAAVPSTNPKREFAMGIATMTAGAIFASLGRLFINIVDVLIKFFIQAKAKNLRIDQVSSF